MKPPPPATELFELQASVNRSKTQRADRKPAAVIKKGSVRVVIYGRGPFTIAWRDSSGGARKRAMRSDLAKARSFAEEKATTLANGETWRLAMGQGDYASYLRAREILIPTGKSLELAAAEFAEAFKRLPPGATIADAVNSFLENSRANIVPKSCPEIVEQLLASKQGEIGSRWTRTLAAQLEKFSGHFNCPLGALRADQINAWLRTLPAGPRGRLNYRAAIMQLANFAQANGYLVKTWDEMARVPIPAVKRSEIKILTPEQLTALLHAAQDSLVPFIALTAFAGIRNEEMSGEKALLDWSNVRFEEGLIYVPMGVGKIGDDRTVPISENLAAWLKPFARRNGPVCNLSGASDALCRAKKKARIPAGKNETRNTLRKSFISYRLALVKNAAQVAEEAGNSVSVIRSNYKRPIPESEARRWFDIWPSQAGILQLQFRMA